LSPEGKRSSARIRRSMFLTCRKKGRKERLRLEKPEPGKIYFEVVA
jgi:hypothetical protein